jgi:small subunit ribosomal protein S5
MAQNNRENQQEFEEKVIRISRVSKKTKGGDQMSFSALMVVGDRKGKVGLGLGKAKGVVDAIKKGVRQAKKGMIDVPINGTTIPFRIEARYGAGHVLLKPAAQGSGVIAGGPVRAIMEAAGVNDISAKILGSDNQASSVYATFEALKKINKIVKVRGIELSGLKQEEIETKPEKSASPKFNKKAASVSKESKKKIKKVQEKSTNRKQAKSNLIKTTQAKKTEKIQAKKKKPSQKTGSK